MKGVPTRISAQGTTPIPQAGGANEGKKRTKAPWILIATLTLFALLGGSAWSLLSVSQGQDLAPSQEDSQEFAPVSDPEDEATEASEEAEQVPDVGVAPAKDPTPASAQSTAVAQETGLGQAPPPNAPIEPSGFDPTPVNNTASLASQPALQTAAEQQAQEQQAQEQQVASGRQEAQGVVSSQTSYAVTESQAHKVSGAQKEQVFESSASPDK